MHEYTCTNTHAHAHTHVHTHMHTRTHIYTHTCTHTYTHAHAHIHIHMHMHTHTHIHTHMHTHIYTRTCTHTYTHAQYENETCLFGNWEVNSVIRPHWSDREGKIEHPDKKLWSPPPGWQWEGDQWLNRRELRSVGRRTRNSWQQDEKERILI